MKETKRHIEAFEYFYFLGYKRSCEKVAKRFGVSDTACSRWRKAFKWGERVQKRDAKIRRKLESEADKTITQIKVEHRKDIKAQMSVLKTWINDIIQDIKTNERRGKAVGVKDMKSLVDSYEKLLKLDMLILGEATERSEVMGGKEVDIPEEIAEKIILEAAERVREIKKRDRRESKK